MKRDLKTVRMKRKASESFGNDIGCSSKSKRSCRRPSESRVYSATCIFCDKVKYKKGSRSREKLTLAVQLRADKMLGKCAVQKMDEKILAVISRDIVAAEAHYHHSCYKNYTRMKISHEPEDDKEDDDEDEMAK